MRSFVVEFNPDRDVTLQASVFDLPNTAEHPTSLECPRPALIICPGGGYEFLSQREIDPPAAAFQAGGFDTFVLRYSIREHATGPNPAIDVARAVRWVRLHADELGVDPERIAVLGFSAGGHVTGLISTQWQNPALAAQERAEYDALVARGLTANAGLMAVSSRPNAVIPAYAVFSFEWVPPEAGMLALDYQDCIAAVTDQVPPTFLWTTGEDATVPPSQSLRYAAALQEAGVAFEYHHFERGAHGLSTGDELSNADRPTLPENVRSWVPLALRWLRATWAK